MHQKMRYTARAAVEAEEVAQAAKAAEGWCPLAAVSAQDTLPHRPLLRTFAQVFRVRDVA